MYRARHYLHDARPLILEDPFALNLLSPQRAEFARAHGFQQPSEFRVAAVILGRSRYAEDRFELALSEGVQQYVALGAGFDTLPQRLLKLPKTIPGLQNSQAVQPQTPK